MSWMFGSFGGSTSVLLHVKGAQEARYVNAEPGSIEVTGL